MLHELSSHCSLLDLRPKNSLVMEEVLYIYISYYILYKCYIYTHTNQVYIYILVMTHDLQWFLENLIYVQIHPFSDKAPGV